MRPIVLFYHSPAKNGHMSPSVRKFTDTLAKFQRIENLVLIDEIDTILTSLTGGINAKLDHTPQILKTYAGIVVQKDNALNIFDTARKYGAKVVGFSGTLNNMIASKIPSTGYQAHEIHIVNVFPIGALYKNLDIKNIDTDNFRELAEKYKRAEGIEGKVLFLVAKTTDIQRHTNEYKTHFGRPMNYVSIIGANSKERETDAWRRKLDSAKYIFGIDLLTVGFDLNTYCPGQHFCLGILSRALSDKISQPLSKNPHHSLHMDESAALLQTLARMRGGGLFLVPNGIEIGSLSEGLRAVFERIRDGRDECLWVGPTRASQKERHWQCLVLGLIQNLRYNKERPIVDEILKRLTEIDGRDFAKEYTDAARTGGPKAFDADYWIWAIAQVWSSFIEDLYPMTKLATTETAIAGAGAETAMAGAGAETAMAGADTKTAIAGAGAETAMAGAGRETVSAGAGAKTAIAGAGAETASAGAGRARHIIQSGGGYSNGRVKDERVTTEVLKRAENTCGHCGDLFEDYDDRQICHIRRNDCDGGYTSDNLIQGHTHCDALYDNGGIIHEDNGCAYWLSKKAKAAYKPDMKQLAGICVANLRHRWEWEKQRQHLDGSTDDEFRKVLVERGYTRVVTHP
jgi:hypothetical protein